MKSLPMKAMLRFLQRMLLAAVLPAYSACAPMASSSTSGGAVNAGTLLAPPAYYQPVTVKEGKEYTCPDFPEPHTGPLIFASKYEGDGSSKSRLNKEAESRYKQGVKSIRELEDLSSKITRDFIRGAGEDARECLLDLLYAWARQDALLHEQANPIGEAMRKWALATTGVHYLQVMQLDSGLPPVKGRKRQVVEEWFADLADNVTGYYSNRGPEKANNHDYWAAWAVMVTAVNLQDRELYGWALDKYRQGVRQIDGQGYLPNEIKRKSRALSYQNYALQPLVMLAVFAEANHQLLPEERQALERLAEKVVAGIGNPQLFQALTGEEQETEDLVSEWSLAWIPPWRAYFDPSIVAPLEATVDSFKSTRLGGDLGWLFSGRATGYRSGQSNHNGKRLIKNFKAEGIDDDTDHFIRRQRQPALASLPQKPAETVHALNRQQDHAAAHARTAALGMRRSDIGLQPGPLLYR